MAKAQLKITVPQARALAAKLDAIIARLEMARKFNYGKR